LEKPDPNLDQLQLVPSYCCFDLTAQKIHIIGTIPTKIAGINNHLHFTRK